ncbi:MAG TPA: sigma-70 family RNA polymerase sigma factor [Candidatus Dormibacteraeota bacterium]|nr:sigma-70 family RNA polymerase sigma factor [Candidatus Dormibacteraeota bacterium]
MSRTPDEDLVEYAKEDRERFGDLYDRYFPQIYRFVYSRVRAQELAEDITSEVFFKALRALDRYRPSGSPFSSWLYQIANNAILDYHRAHRHLEGTIDDALEVADRRAGVADQVVERDLLGEVWRAIATLPEHQRAAMTLKYQEDLKNAQIGQILGKSEGAVKLLIFRGTRAVRGQLTERGVVLPERDDDAGPLPPESRGAEPTGDPV